MLTCLLAHLLHSYGINPGYDCIDCLLVIGCGVKAVLNLLFTNISTFFMQYPPQGVGTRVSALVRWVCSLGCHEVEPREARPRPIARIS